MIKDFNKSFTQVIITVSLGTDNELTLLYKDIKSTRIVIMDTDTYNEKIKT